MMSANKEACNDVEVNMCAFQINVSQARHHIISEQKRCWLIKYKKSSSFKCKCHCIKFLFNNTCRRWCNCALHYPHKMFNSHAFIEHKFAMSKHLFRSSCMWMRKFTTKRGQALPVVLSFSRTFFFSLFTLQATL